MMSKNIKTLHAETAVISNGEAVVVVNADTFLIQIFGTSTSFTLNFQASLDGVNYFDVEGINIGDTTIAAASTSTIDEGWEFEITDCIFFRAAVTAIGNGNVSVLGWQQRTAL